MLFRSDVNAILLSINREELYIDDITIYKRKKHTYSFSVHFIFEDENVNMKNRIKFTIYNDTDDIYLNNSPKYWVGGENAGVQKYIENNSKKTLASCEDDEMVIFRNTIICAYVKKRHKTIYVNNKGRIKISLDSVIGINPINYNVCTSPFYHLEFESDCEKNVNDITNSPFFKLYIRDKVCELTDDGTKWLQSATICDKGTRVAMSRDRKSVV